VIAKHTFHVFGASLIAGAVASYASIVTFARRSNVATGWRAEALAIATVGGALLGGSIAAGSLGSLGALFASAVAAAAIARLLRLELLRVADVLAITLPIGLLFVRLGCALVHDHVGAPSSSPLAVAFPSGARFDLGVLEWLAMPPLLVCVLIVRARTRRPGLVFAVTAIAYGALRVALEFAKSR